LVERAPPQRHLRYLAHAAVALLALPGLAHRDTSACRVTAQALPNVAVVGQQILYRVRIVRRQDVDKVDWERGLSFPDFRAEWLPGHAEDTQMHYRGMTFVAREEDRALFATHAGVFEIPEASLRCTVRGRGPDPARSEIVRVPAVGVRVVEPPTQGRPNDFAGAVGPLWVQTSVGAQELHLGESLSVSILVRGAGNLWDLPSPLHDDDFDGEVFWRPAETELEAGEQLYLRRYFRFDLVPHEVGPLRIPAVRLPYYDHRVGHYAVAEAQAVTVDVVPRARGKDSSARRPGASPRSNAPDGGLERSAEASTSTTSEGGGSAIWFATGALSLSCLGIALATGALRRRRRWAPTREALAEADEAREARDERAEASALSRALYAAAAVVAPYIESPSPKMLREHARNDGPTGDLTAAADAIEALERERFSSDAHPSATGTDDARAAIERLRNAPRPSQP
jgi:hypothetical protein